MSPLSPAHATATSASPSDEEIPPAEVELEKTRLLFQNAGMAQAVTVTNGLVLLFILGGFSPPPWAIAWWLTAAAVSAYRYLLARRFFAAADPATAAPWRRRAVVGALVAGLVWAGGGIAFMTAGSEATRLFTALVLSGMVAGGVSILSAVPIAFTLYAGQVMVAIVATALIDAHSSRDWLLAFVASLFLFALLRSARLFHDSLDKSIRLGLRMRHMAERLDRARLSAEAASVAKSQFLATMSHEIRTPMNGILGMAQLLLMPDLRDAERLDYSRTILNSGQTLLTLLNDILDLSKVEAGRMDLHLAAFAPAQLLQDIVALFAEPAASKGLSLDARWSGAANARYRSDPTRLRQMLSNLVSNAIKFTDAGSIRIEADEVGRQGDTALLRFSVSDTGIGIAEDKRALLFQPFSQIDASNIRRHAGTGLGLSIVRNLAMLLGGDVDCDSAAGQGSTFRFRVRAAIVAGGEDSRRIDRAAPPGAETRQRARILVVEDNDVNRKVIEAILGKRGHSVRSVENGRLAVESIAREEPADLVLMDCQMPEMDGYEATKRIRAWERDHGRPRLPIIALTAGAFAEDRDHCLAAGMDDFLVKPLDVATLAATLDKWLAGREAPPPR